MKLLTFLTLIVSTLCLAFKIQANSSEFTSHIIVELSPNHKVLNFNAQMYRLSKDKVLLRQTFSSIQQYLSLLDALAKNTQVNTVTSHLVMVDHDASYFAKEYRLKPEQRNFIKVQRLYLKNGYASEIRDLMARYKRAFAANNIKRDVLVYQGITGKDLPYVEIVRFAKTQQDDAEYEEKVNQAFGKALLIELSTSFGKYIRKGDASLDGVKVSSAS